ncbi:MAG: hypothetical protein Q8881_03660, partial [Sweet potato little leaf phytoplasma]|nr:hypothetical protein [Sweet potato little leaf phytoplasma]
PLNFALGDESPKPAESIPPNSRRISYSGRFRRNGRINPVECLPNFALGDVSDETVELLPNFALRDVSPETAEFPPNIALGDVSDETAESILPNLRRI